MIWDSRESFRNRDVQRTSIRKKLVLVFCKYGGLYERKWKIAVAFLVLGVFIVAGNLRVSATESEDLFLKDILDDSTYVKAILGGGYLGKTILYDVDGEKTVVYPK